jgi:hypothetical protein
LPYPTLPTPEELRRYILPSFVWICSCLFQTLTFSKLNRFSEHLHLFYIEKVSINNLELSPGIYALTGKNGSGKSSTYLVIF